MTDQELISKIKRLKQISPSQKWVGLTRNNLISQIEFNEPTIEPIVAFWSRLGFIGVFNWLKQAHPVLLSFSLTFVFLIGPLLAIKASQASLPGELLYPIKRISEGIQTTVASEKAKAQLQVEFASRRLEELSKITNDSFTPEEKAEKVKQVVYDLKETLTGATAYAPKISKEKAIEVVKKTKQIKDNLIKTKASVPLVMQNTDNTAEAEKLIADLTAAEKAITEINQQVLAVLAQDVQDGQGELPKTATSTSGQEIMIFLEETENGSMTTTDKIIQDIHQ